MVLLSSEHFEDDVAGEAENYKPDIILHYNHTKGGVDCTDKMAKEYSTIRGTNRWPMVLFGHLLDIAGINAFRIWEDKKGTVSNKVLDARR